MSTTHLVHDNQRGDIESITDPSNTIVSQSHFDPWGNQITHVGTLPQSFGYAGYYYDDETGLYYLKSRYYSPALGRFLTRDGIDYIETEKPQTLNLYSYCLNNPVSLTDPEGTYAATISYESGAAALATASLWLGAEAAKNYTKQTATNVWAALQDGWAKAKTYLANSEKDGTPKTNTKQNKDFDYASKGLNKDQARRLHDKISGKNLSLDGMIKQRNNMFPKYPHPNPKFGR